MNSVYIPKYFLKGDSIMLESISFQKDVLELSSKANQQDYSFSKGQRIIYEGKKAEIISVKPLFIIKTKNGVVCGNIKKLIGYIRKYNIFDEVSRQLLT